MEKPCFLLNKIIKELWMHQKKEKMIAIKSSNEPREILMTVITEPLLFLFYCCRYHSRGINCLNIPVEKQLQPLGSYRQADCKVTKLNCCGKNFKSLIKMLTHVKGLSVALYSACW